MKAKFEAAARLGHKEAAQKLREVEAMLGAPSGGAAPLKDVVDKHNARVDQIKFEIERNSNPPTRSRGKGVWRRRFQVREARDQIRYLPAEVPDRDAKMSRVDRSLASAKSSLEKARRDEARRKQEDAAQKALNEENSTNATRPFGSSGSWPMRRRRMTGPVRIRHPALRQRITGIPENRDADDIAARARRPDRRGKGLHASNRRSVTSAGTS